MIINETDLERDIDDLIRPLGVTRRGERRTRLLKALFLICENEDRLNAVVKEIYCVVGKDCHCSSDAVDHSIHQAACTAWKTNRAYLMELAGYPLDAPPSAADFLEILYNRLVRQRKDNPLLIP